MDPFGYYSEASDVDFLISSQILEELGKDLFSDLPFTNKQTRDVGGEPKSPLRELQKVLTIAF
jgi:hypothetical protein